MQAKGAAADMEPNIQSFGMWVETWRVEILLVLALLILVAALVLLIVLFRRVSAGVMAELHDRLTAFDQRLHDGQPGRQKQRKRELRDHAGRIPGRLPKESRSVDQERTADG